MADLTPNHPADKVAARALCVSDEAEIAASEAYAQGVGERPFSQRMRAALSAALPHMTADDLRSTPAGQALIREGIAAARTDVPWLLEQVGLRDKALEAVLELHKDGGESQGYLDDGSYGDMPHCCTECGSLGEYGVPYPCPTVTAIRQHLGDDQ